ncbi:MAG: hypothetical protein WCQ95_06880 [Bacteroidota bacterium]
MKKIKNWLFLLFVSILLAASCKTINQQQLFSIGKGGGFTGKYEEYLVKSTGEIYKIAENKSPELIKTLNSKRTNEVFTKFEQINITTLNFSHPGNITSYIRYTLNGKSYEIKWGDNKVVPPQNIVDFFDLVWNIVKQK